LIDCFDFCLDQNSGNNILVTARASARKKTGNELLIPFMTLKYDSNSLNLDELDVINKPAYVIPISTLRSQLVETDRLIRKQTLFTAIPFAFLQRDDWEDLSRGLTWSETEVSVGESKRLITYKCTKRQRAEAMALCVSSLAITLPVPLKGRLVHYEDIFDGGGQFTLHFMTTVLNMVTRTRTMRTVMKRTMATPMMELVT
jgi:hypothetical protein